MHSCEICGVRLNDWSDLLSPLPAPLVDRLSSSNDAPTPHDKKILEGHLLRTQKRLDAFDEVIENLCKARADLKREQVKNAGLISSLCAFPPEILSAIFLVYSDSWWEDVEASKSNDELDGWNSLKRALCGGLPAVDTPGWSLIGARPMDVVSQVCCRWRAVALGTSALWTGIYLDEAHIGGVSKTRRLLSSQLNSSSIQPLRINISIPPISQLYEQYHTLLSQHIIPEHRRWTDVKIPMTTQTFSLFPNCTTLLFPLLASLRIDFVGEGIICADELFSAANAPLLTNVVLNWPSYPINNGPFQLPWDQLRKLQLVGCQGDEAFAIIQQLQNVEELTLLKLQDEDEDIIIPLQEIVTLRSLRYLRISNVGCSDFSPGILLPHLHLPALKTLIWTQMNRNDTTFLSTMIRETWPNGDCGLTELYLLGPCDSIYEDLDGDDSTPMEQLLDLLYPHIEIFEIEYPSPSGTDFRSFVIRLLSLLRHNMVPNLRAFKLQGGLLEPWDIWELLSELMEHNIDARLVKCAFNVRILYEGSDEFGTMDTLQGVLPTKGHLELDIEGANSECLTYFPQSGLRIENMPP